MKNSQYRIKQEKFEGPLDLLLDLIEKRRLAISEISLSAVTDDYLSRIRAMGEVNQEDLAEFLVVAAQLMLIKSRSLLPQLALTPAEEESVGDLECRLALYQRMRGFARELKVKESECRHILTRPPYLGLPVIFYPPPRFSLERLSHAFSLLVKAMPQLRELTEERLRKIVSLEDMIRGIQARLAERLEQAFSELVRNSQEKVEVIVSFLAILELAKQKLVSLHQGEHFGEIIITRSE